MDCLKKTRSYGDRRAALLHMAKISERAERYKDMRMYMRELASDNKDNLSKTEQDLLTIAYKRSIGNLRSAWKAVQNGDDESKYDVWRRDYRKLIEKSLIDECYNALDLFEKVLTNSKTSDVESRVFYLKMTADFYRFLAEVWLAKGNVDKGVARKADDFYRRATVEAEANLECTTPIRLDVALNYSVCTHEIFAETKQACFVAKQAFDRAISKLDNLDEASYKDSTLIMQLLRDNLTLWTSNRSSRSR